MTSGIVRSILLNIGSIAFQISLLADGRTDGQTDGYGEGVHTQVQTYCQPTFPSRLGKFINGWRRVYLTAGQRKSNGRHFSLSQMTSVNSEHLSSFSSSLFTSSTHSKRGHILLIHNEAILV